MSMDRRQFVKNSALALALGAMGNTLFDLLAPREASAFDLNSFSAPLPAGTPILVMIELFGGLDILNTHVPYAVPGVSNHYFAGRPLISLKNVTSTRPYVAPPSGNYAPPVLDLDGHYGLHGNLPWLANRWWERGDVAIVQGVGESVALERSHFAASAYRSAAAFSGPHLETGWLGRYNDIRNQNQILASVSLSGLNLALPGSLTRVLGVSDVAGFNWQLRSNVPSRAQLVASLQGLADPAFPASLNKAAQAALALRNTNTAIATLKAASQPTLNAGLAKGTLAYQLAQAAMMITAGMPCQTYVATLGGFDLHGSSMYPQFAQLGLVDAALNRFFSVIDASPRAQDVFVLITSEFGRQVKENAGQGTDHGRASSAFLVGGGVTGGLYGQMPDLAVRDFDSMIPTVDFRSLFATVLNRLGGDTGISSEVLGKDESGSDFEDLGVFA